jgi:hypothetical protein
MPAAQPGRTGIRTRRQAATAALAAIAVVTLAACTSGSRPASAKPAAADSRLVDSQVADSYFPATLTQVAKGVAFQQAIRRLRTGVLAACVRQLGLGKPAQLYAYSLYGQQIRPRPGWVPQNVSYGLVDLDAVKRSGMAVPTLAWKVGPAVPGLSPGIRAAVQGDIPKCLKGFNKLYGPMVSGGLALMRLWARAEDGLQDSAAVRGARASFTACLVRRGAPRSASGSLSSFNYWLTNLVNHGVIAGPRSPGLAPVRQRMRLDARWSAVFAACAGPVLAAMRPREGQLQATFRQQHFGPISAVEKQMARFENAITYSAP